MLERLVWVVDPNGWLVRLLDAGHEASLPPEVTSPGEAPDALDASHSNGPLLLVLSRNVGYRFSSSARMRNAVARDGNSTVHSPNRATTRALVRFMTIVWDGRDWSLCSTMTSMAVSVHLGSTFAPAPAGRVYRVGARPASSAR